LSNATRFGGTGLLPLSRFLLVLTLLLTVATATRAELLPPVKLHPQVCDSNLFVLAWDHSPGWYWPTLDSLGASRWWVYFASPADLEVHDCRIATYGGSGESVTINLIYLGNTEAQVDTLLCGYLEEGYEVIPFPEPTAIPAGESFRIEVVYEHYFGPPYMTADNDGNGNDTSWMQNSLSQQPIQLFDRDLCIRVGVTFDGDDPLAPTLQLSPLPLVWEGNGHPVTFSSRITDHSPLASVELEILADGAPAAVYDLDPNLLPLSTAVLSDFDWLTTVDYQLALTAVDAFSNTGRDTTDLFNLPADWPDPEQVTSGARFADYYTGADPVNSTGGALAVRLTCDNSDLLAFQPRSARVRLLGEQPFTFCITPDAGGQPAPMAGGSYPQDLNWSYMSVVDPGPPPDTGLARWVKIEFASTGEADTLFLAGEPFWAVLLYPEEDPPDTPENSFGCDSVALAGSSWRFSTSAWEFREMETGNLLLEVIGEGASCYDIYSDSLLYEEFEGGQPLCWVNSYPDTNTVGWEFGATATTWFTPDYRTAYAFKNSDLHYNDVIQDTLLTPYLSLDVNAQLAFLSWLRLHDMADISSARVIWRQDSEQFGDAQLITQEATSDWDSIYVYPTAWRQEAIQLANPEGSLLQIGFVYAANNPGEGCYGWAIDSVCVTDTSGFTLYRWEGEWVKSFEVSPAFPNPFNPATTIAFRLQEPDRVTARVYDLLGREVRLLLEDVLLEGEQELRFDATGLASGIYFVRFQTRTNQSNVIRKALYLK